MTYPLPWLRLQFTPGLGRAGLMRLIEHYKTPAAALANRALWAKDLGLRADLGHSVPPPADPVVEKALQRLKQTGARLQTFWDADYPEKFRTMIDPPALLYRRGALPEGPAVAIVGSRRPTHFGRHFTTQLAEELAAAGVTIVSGLARGIDAAAHRGALNADGRTVAVLGCGIDRVYPPENTRLHEEILATGAILSEYPPGAAPLPGHFPGRNRLISALGDATLIVEATRDSGSLITAEFALEQGRDVMAVPGGIDRDTSYGPNHLIKQGAHPVTEASEILQIIGALPSHHAPRKRGKDVCATLPEPERSVLRQLTLTPRHSDELAGESGLTPMELSVILLHLELQGFAEKLPGGHFILGPRAI